MLSQEQRVPQGSVLDSLLYRHSIFKLNGEIQLKIEFKIELNWNFFLVIYVTGIHLKNIGRLLLIAINRWTKETGFGFSYEKLCV